MKRWVVGLSVALFVLVLVSNLLGPAPQQEEAAPVENVKPREEPSTSPAGGVEEVGGPGPQAYVRRWEVKPPPRPPLSPEAMEALGTKPEEWSQNEKGEWEWGRRDKTVKGPPGKPSLEAGATREEVRAAWGDPVGIVPERVLDLPMTPRSGPRGAKEPWIFRETWTYPDKEGVAQGYAHFDENGLAAGLLGETYPGQMEEKIRRNREWALQFAEETAIRSREIVQKVVERGGPTPEELAQEAALLAPDGSQPRPFTPEIEEMVRRHRERMESNRIEFERRMRNR